MRDVLGFNRDLTFAEILQYRKLGKQVLQLFDTAAEHDKEQVIGSIHVEWFNNDWDFE